MSTRAPMADAADGVLARASVSSAEGRRRRSSSMQTFDRMR